LNAFLKSPMHGTWPTHLTLLDCLNNIWWTYIGCPAGGCPQLKDVFLGSIQIEKVR
jgi:hypothetical protein